MGYLDMRYNVGLGSEGFVAQHLIKYVWKITFFVQNFGLDYEDTLYQIIDCSNAVIIVKNYYLINKTYLSLAGNVWNIEKCENL